jgi:hypothetical protein
MNDAKVQLSKDELWLVREAGWILTKNAIIGKQYLMFGMLSEQMTRDLEKISLPVGVRETSPKISKGEALEGLPYVILDYPRVYSKTNVFAIRILFWWAHYFSLTWHLKGGYQSQFADSVIANREKLAAEGFYIYVTENEWEHKQEEAHATAIGRLDETGLRDIISNHPFLKLTVRISVVEWNQADELLMKAFHCICGIIG